MPAPKRITVRDVTAADLVEPVLRAEDREEYLRGWELFNRREYWHAHEAWEVVWKLHPEPSRLFLEGIIQLAAAYHLLTAKRRYAGMMGNFAKAEEKLHLFAELPADDDAARSKGKRMQRLRGGEVHRVLGVDVRGLLHHIAAARIEIGRIGAERLEEFPLNHLPHVSCSLPTASDR